MLCIITVFILAYSMGAAAGDAWFGVESPETRQRRSEQFRTALTSPDLAPLSIRLPAEEDPYREIRGAEVFRYLQDIAEVTHTNRPEGEKYWGRIAGSRAEVATAEYLAEQFRHFNLSDVHLETVHGGKQWWPLNWEVTLLGEPAYGAGTTDYTFSSAFPALQLEGKGEKAAALEIDNLEAELIFIGQGHTIDLMGRNLEGKVAVVLANLQPDAFFQTARGYVHAIEDAGAIGLITVMDGPGNHQYALEDMGPASLPAFVLGGDDGRFLIDAMAAAGADQPLRVRINYKTEIRSSWEGQNVLATVPGQIDEWVVVIAHLDGYFESANDNAAGIASMLALARYFSSTDEKPQRNMLFVGTSGHHEFSDGAAIFIQDHADILDKTVVVMNVEHPASTMSYYRGALKFKRFTVPGQLMTTTTHGARSLNVSNSNPLIINFYRQAIDRYGLVIDAILERRPPTGDAIAFFRAGNTVLQILDANIWYHSDGDLIDTIPSVGLERATRIYAEVLDKIDQHTKEDLARKR